MNIWRFLREKAYWSGYLDGIRSRETPTTKKTYRTSLGHRKRELIRYHRRKIAEIKER